MLRYLDIIIAFAVIMLALSLVITLFNQMISSFLSFRGANLRWGVQTMLRTLDPQLIPHAEAIANRLLTAPIVSDSIFAKHKFAWLQSVPVLRDLVHRWKLASAIGPDTLIRTLRNLSADDLRLDPNDPTATLIKELLTKVDPSAEDKLKLVQDAFKTLGNGGPDYTVQVDDFLRRAGNSVQESVGAVEAWFNVAMGRVSQRFTMQIRIWTVIFSFLLAFGLHLDTLDVINQLIANPTTVQNLVSQSGAMLKQAEAVLGNQTEPGSDATALTISPKVLNEQMKGLVKEVKPEEFKSAPVTVPSFRTLADAEKWLSDNLKPEPDVTKERKAELIGKYKEMVVTGLGKEIGNINKTLKETGIQLVRNPEKIDSVRAWARFVFTYSGIKNFLGVLLTAGLLALGAPFWYNALKNLVNLRPMVAQRQAQQKKES